MRAVLAVRGVPLLSGPICFLPFHFTSQRETTFCISRRGCPKYRRVAEPLQGQRYDESLLHVSEDFQLIDTQLRFGFGRRLHLDEDVIEPCDNLEFSQLIKHPSSADRQWRVTRSDYRPSQETHTDRSKTWAPDSRGHPISDWRV